MSNSRQMGAFFLMWKPDEWNSSMSWPTSLAVVAQVVIVLIIVRQCGHLGHLGRRYVFVRCQEQHNFPFLILDRNNVQQTPKRRSCREPPHRDGVSQFRPKMNPPTEFFSVLGNEMVLSWTSEDRPNEWNVARQKWLDKTFIVKFWRLIGYNVII